MYPEPRYFPIVRAFAGDSTMTRRPRPPLGAARDFPLVVDRFGAFPAARRGLAFVSSGIVFKVLRAMLVMKKRERNKPLDGGDIAGNGAEP